MATCMKSRCCRPKTCRDSQCLGSVFFLNGFLFFNCVKIHITKCAIITIFGFFSSSFASFLNSCYFLLLTTTDVPHPHPHLPPPIPHWWVWDGVDVFAKHGLPSSLSPFTCDMGVPMEATPRLVRLQWDDSCEVQAQILLYNCLLNKGQRLL